MMIKFEPWTTTECNDCSCDFQVSRTLEVAKAEENIICESCESYRSGYEDAKAEAFVKRINHAKGYNFI